MTLRFCANPVCLCRSTDFTCSLGCGSGEMADEVRCFCRHEECLRVLGLRSPSAATQVPLPTRGWSAASPRRAA